MSKKQTDLPGMEDREIKELEEAAEEYAEIRDERMALTEREVGLKERLLAAMKKHKRNTYLHGQVEIQVVAENEKVKVKIKKEKEAEAE